MTLRRPSERQRKGGSSGGGQGLGKGGAWGRRVHGGSWSSRGYGGAGSHHAMPDINAIFLSLAKRGFFIEKQIRT